MLLRDFLRLSIGSIRSSRTRSLLTVISIAIGVASVVILTSIGEGLQRFVLAEFTQFGTHLVAVTPGKTGTFGISGAIINNVRPLSIDDAQSLARLQGVEAVVPVVQGSATVEHAGLSRHTMILGVGSEVPKVWRMHTSTGKFLPADDPRYARPFAVIGDKIRSELFTQQNPLGKRLRIASETFRIIGVMEKKGQLLGFDLDDAVYIPAGKALAMFNEDSLMEIDLLYATDTSSEKLAKRISTRLKQRHGHEDFSITTQDQMLDSLGSVLNVLTLSVAALGSLSLLVGAVGILTIMTIAVTQRSAEVGLLSALGASSAHIRWLFLFEAAGLSAIGGLAGLLGGLAIIWLTSLLLPALPVHISLMYILMAEGVAIIIGVLAGIYPAMQATELNPVEALRQD